MCEISQLKRQNELARNNCVFVDTYPIYLLNLFSCDLNFLYGY